MGSSGSSLWKQKVRTCQRRVYQMIIHPSFFCTEFISQGLLSAFHLFSPFLGSFLCLKSDLPSTVQLRIYVSVWNISNISPFVAVGCRGNLIQDKTAKVLCPDKFWVKKERCRRDYWVQGWPKLPIKNVASELSGESRHNLEGWCSESWKLWTAL